jgi:hypothetical protein
MSKFYFTTNRDEAQQFSENSIVVEWDYSSSCYYQLDLWFKEEVTKPTTQQMKQLNEITGGCYNHPVMILKTAEELFPLLTKFFPTTDIVLVDSMTERGIRCSKDIAAKHCIQILKERLEKGDWYV